MGTRKMIVTLGMFSGLLATHGMAFAHGSGKQGAMVPADAQMKKLHAMMPMFSLASAGMERALEKGEFTQLETEAGKITSAIPDLKKSKPHKKINQRRNFLEHVTDLETAVSTTVELAKTGNFIEAKASFKKVEGACTACHAKFRD
ncbi:MAG: cytochrome c [Desulfuromonadaceae bacterium]|nr:cytochrome c [Desulfuromonadaceae bacterium]